jgi:glycosyltransferase involved in cell wall biosynthesis
MLTETTSSAHKPLPRALLVANGDRSHVGAHLIAGESPETPVTLIDIRAAWEGPRLWGRILHHFAGKRPARLGAFSARVASLGGDGRFTHLITTGVAPVTARVLAQLRDSGLRTVNFLTDDPWNPVNGAAHFWSALRQYDVVFTPRTANLGDLHKHGCRDVRYLPFAYNPDEHFPEAAVSAEERSTYQCDVAFIGGADAQRVELLRPLLATALSCNLYGGYWERHAATREHARGMVVERNYRLAVSGARVNVCMGRLANRDGHAMRSYELPAMGAALVVEDTSEHRDMFGADEASVLYYRSAESLAAQVVRLCSDEALRARLAQAARQRVATPANTYAARLKTMLAAS